MAGLLLCLFILTLWGALAWTQSTQDDQELAKLSLVSFVCSHITLDMGGVCSLTMQAEPPFGPSELVAFTRQSRQEYEQRLLELTSLDTPQEAQELKDRMVSWLERCIDFFASAEDCIADYGTDYCRDAMNSELKSLWWGQLSIQDEATRLLEDSG